MRHRRFGIVCVVLIALGGCEERKNVACDQDSNCDLASGGRCVATPSGNQWCAYPDGACPNGLRFSDFGVGDGLANECVGVAAGGDAGTNDAPAQDAPPDGPRIHAFDVAYPNEWKFSVAGPVGGYFLAINTGSTALSMNTLVIKSIDDDHPTATVRITAAAVASSVPPGTAGGKLTPLSNDVLVGSNLVTETRSDTTTDYMNIEIINAPSGTYDIHVDLVVGLDNLSIPMPMTIHILPPGVVYADPVLGARLKVYR